MQQSKAPRVYALPPEEMADRQAKALRRRAALTAAGCATYEIGQRKGQQAIQCLCCGLGSSNATDIAERYCGFCHTFHSEWSDE